MGDYQVCLQNLYNTGTGDISRIRNPEKHYFDYVVYVTVGIVGSSNTIPGWRV
jgi:hypothetical protein